MSKLQPGVSVPGATAGRGWFFRSLGTLGVVAAALAGGARPAMAAGAQAGGGRPAAAGAQAEPWDARFFAAPPAEVQAAAVALSPRNHDSVALLWYEVRLSFDEAGRVTRTVRQVYRVVNANADNSWMQVENSWLPWHQERPRMRARVVSEDGQVHLLDPQVVAEVAARDGDPEVFSDRRVVRGPLPAVAAGAVVEEEDTVVDTAPLFERGVLLREQLAEGLPVAHVRVVLEAPAALPLHYALRRLPGVVPRREGDAAGGRQRLVFDIGKVAGVKSPPPGLPPEAAPAPAIEISTAASWQDIARAYSQIVDRSLAGADLTAWLSQGAPSGAVEESQSDTIAHLATRLAAIRYTGVELGDGGIVPRRPAETLARRFGDCKDKSVLLVAALRAMEIPAYVALLAAGDDDWDVDPALPGFGAFNHAIVFVPGVSPIWIDPTDPHARAGDLPMGDQGRYALIAAPGTTALIRTPAATAAENHVVKRRDFFLADRGPARVVETLEYGGQLERHERAVFAARNAEELRKMTADHAAQVFSGKASKPFDHPDPADLSQPFRLHLEITGARRGFTDDSDAAVAIPYSAVLDYLPDALTPDDDAGGGSGRKGAAADGGDAESDGGGGGDANAATDPSNPAPDAGAAAAAAGPHRAAAPPRRDDFYFDLPYSLEAHYRVVPPQGFAPDELPPSRELRLGSASLSQRFAVESGGAVTADLRFDTGKQRLSPAEMAEMREAVGKLMQEPMLTLKFRQSGEAEAAAGHIREALQEFRREAAAAPGKAMPHMRMARALLAGGLGEAAQREARRATEIEPRSAAAFSVLGWTLQHDAIGRRFGQGFQRDMALAAYAKAEQLDPAYVEARADRAILLEHDADGQRWTAGSNLREAIAEYQALVKQYDVHDYDQNLVIALLYASRYDEARALAGKLADSTAKRQVLAVTTAHAQGADVALREIERATNDTGQRLEILEGAAATLVRLRAYAAAAALLERGSPWSADASTLVARAAVLRQVRPLAELPVPPGEPASVVRRLMQLIATAPGKDAERLSQLYSRGFLDAVGVGQQLDATAPQVMRQAVLDKVGASGGGLAVDQLLEIGLSAQRETVSGSDATGYRIRMEATVGNATREDFFVVREGGSYKLAASGNMPSMLGVEALRRVTAGDLAGARQWLDWARELTPEPQGDPPAPAFSALWTLGAQGDAQQARCAAAALAVLDQPKRMLPVLTACRDAEQDAARQQVLDLILATAAARGERWQELADRTRRLVAARPQSERPFEMASLALSELHQLDALVDLANQRLQLLPGDHPAQMQLAYVEEQRGDLDAAERRLQKLVATGTAASAELNSLAWMMAVRGQADAQAIDLAERAVRARKTHAVLHTLAVVLAEGDRPSEAYKAILQAIDSAEGQMPESVDWYVFGRLAEHYGLPDEARTLYQRVSRSGESLEPAALDTSTLARRRMAALPPASAPEAGRKP